MPSQANQIRKAAIPQKPCERKDLGKTALLRQALRLCQIVKSKAENGESASSKIKDKEEVRGGDPMTCVKALSVAI